MPPKRLTTLERQQLPSAAKVTGKTLRLTGTLDLQLAAHIFAIGEDVLDKIERLNLSDTWRIHPSGMLPLVSWVQGRGKPIRIRCANNPWVKRWIGVHGYDAFLSGRSDSNSTLAVRRARHYPSDGPEAHQYVTAMLHEILQRTACGQDVAESLEWASSELIGNVFHHSESPIGAFTHFIVLKGNVPRAVFTLVDRGMGILKSLRVKYPNLKTDAQAIELALMRGITSKRENQGWGLFGSEAIVSAAAGKLTIWSGSSRLTISEDRTRRYDDVPYFNGTVIEWILPLRANLSLATVLESPNRASSYQLELYEPRLGTITLELRREGQLFRDRPTGKKLRTKLLNLIENSHAKHCVINFDQVGTLTSSFADEFLGKTALLLGPKFKHFVSLTGISDINKAIVETAIQARLRSEENATTPQFIRSRS